MERLEAGRTRALAEALARDAASLEGLDANDRQRFQALCEEIKASQTQARRLEEEDASEESHATPQVTTARGDKYRHLFAKLRHG